MLLDPLGDWAVDPQTGRFELLRATSDAPETWLRWASEYLDQDLWRRQWPAPGVEAISGCANVYSILRVSHRTLHRIITADELSVLRTGLHSKAGIRTTLSEVWKVTKERTAASLR